jgi:hypothetical protein
VDVTVRDSSDRSRYEAVVDGEVIGFANYHAVGHRVVFPHVEVDAQWQGRGIASAIVRQAFDDVISQGKTIRPLCPFAVGFVRRYPEYEGHTG